MRFRLPSSGRAPGCLGLVLLLPACLALPALAAGQGMAQGAAQGVAQGAVPAADPAPVLAGEAPVRRAAPSIPLGPELTVSPANALPDPVTGRLTLMPGALPPPARGLPTINPGDKSPAALLLGHLVAIGQAAGLAGVLYDNRDRGHSRLAPQMFPALTRIAYDPAFRDQGLDFGPAGPFRFPAITFGNSSTAITSGLTPRSLARLLMTAPGEPWRAWDDYTSNAIYLYPGHHDHGATDLYPAAWPYTLSSQGSSGSDKPFLRAVAMILAAFPADTRAALEAEGLVAPTVQMVFRRAQTGVKSRADYLSGAAHPSVFSSAAIDLPAMVALANSLAPGEIPPVVRLAVESEDFADHAGLLGGDERLFDTPSAIARLWRGPAWQHQMVVSAAQTVDPNGRPLRFDWVLLRGDPSRVTIAPLDAEGRRARITIDWQEPRPAPAGFATEGPGPMSDRVDIGVFAENGPRISAPAFVSVDLPGQQLRRYEPGPAGTMRLAETDYDGNQRGATYDPLLWWSAPWRDLYHYDAQGRLTGWARQSTRPAGPPEQDFAADGVPAAGAPIRYTLKKPGADLRATPE